MWTIVTILENGNIKVIETIGDDAEAVKRYKTLVENRHAPGGLVENRHAPGGFGYTPVYLSRIEFLKVMNFYIDTYIKI